MSEERLKHSFRITDKGIAAYREALKYPESERPAALNAMLRGDYEKWQEERLQILDADTIQ